MKRFAFCLLFLLGGAAYADGHRAAPPNATWQAECGACHLAYPPGLLPASAWRQLMAGLDRHFGANASLDEAPRQDILNYLERYAGREGRAVPASLRISESAWFRRKHDEVPTRYWRDSRVRQGANCSACHRDAEAGRFSEHTVRLPDGRSWE